MCELRAATGGNCYRGPDAAGPCTLLAALCSLVCVAVQVSRNANNQVLLKSLLAALAVRVFLLLAVARSTLVRAIECYPLL